MRGYYSIGIENTKNGMNLGTLWRSAFLFKAAYIFTIGHRYRIQASDTVKAYRNIPLYMFDTFTDFYKTIPYDCRLIGIELTEEAIEIVNYKHPERCIYLLGAEDNGLSKDALCHCHDILVLPGDMSMNVASAGSIVMYDRFAKQNKGGVNCN